MYVPVKILNRTGILLASCTPPDGLNNNGRHFPRINMVEFIFFRVEYKVASDVSLLVQYELTALTTLSLHCDFLILHPSGRMVNSNHT